MYIYHNSRKKEYRSPFGALPTESLAEISLLVEESVSPCRVFLRLWDGEEHFVEMKNTDGGMYLAKLKIPETAGLLWYYFVIEADNRKYYYCKGRGGEGEVLDYSNDSSWQITVYDKNFRTPDWFKKSIMYQIFPDRFSRSGKLSEIPSRTSEYIIHEDWYEPLIFNRHPFEDGPASNDFFGGNLKGIAEKIPYFKELGIGVLYLNPIFEAFSNHRYDTGDYSKIDPILGTEEDFKELCQKCDEAGIKIILDGVFSHTGSDSIYFNKYGSYGENTGAFRDKNSPFHSWYQWCDEGGGYHSWWGCSNLPNVNELDATYIDYILQSDDAIIKKWIKNGAFGWRLDVADELPDSFIKILRKEVKKQNPQAVIIGEVWEDASNKESYGKRREYLLGEELDSVMNYPFKDNVIGFLTGAVTGEEFSERLMTIAENYPFESIYSAMNLLGTHDTIRIKTVLSGRHIDSNWSREEKESFRLDAKSETLAIKRMKLGAFLQMTFAGVPCIYYGDEIGMQGLSDPFNRMPYTWRCVDTELLEFYKKMAGIRNSLDCLRTGSFETVYAKNGVFAFVRKIEGGKDVFGKKAKNGTCLCVINRDETSQTAEIFLDGVSELEGLIYGEKIIFKEGRCVISVPEFGAEIFKSK